MSLSAQNTQLEQYIAEGLSNNLRLQQADLDIRQSIQELELARSRFYPQIAFEANYTLAQGGRSIAIPIGDLLNPVYGTLNEITQSNSFPTLQNVEEQLLPNQFHETKLTFAQPLFNTDVWFAWKARKNLIPVQLAKKQAYQNNLVHEIRSGWYRYQQAIEGQKIWLSAQKVMEEVLRVNRSLVKHHKATSEVVFSAEAQLAEIDQKIAEADKSQRVAAAWFNFLLNRDLQSPIVTGEEEPLPLLPEDESLGIAQRSELQQVRSALLANQDLVDMEKARRWLPSAYVGGEVGFQGFGYTFDTKQDYYLLRFGLKWALFRGGQQKAKVQLAQTRISGLNLQLQELQQQLELQLIQVVEAFKASEAQLHAAQKARVAAEQSFRIIKRKYEEGQVLLIELIQAQDVHTRAQLAESLSRYQLLIDHSDLLKTIAQQ